MKKTFLLFTFLLSLFSVINAQDVTNSEIAIYNEVESAFEIGFYPGTVEKTNLLQKEYPDSVLLLPALVKKGESLINIQRYEDAIVTLNDAILRMHTGSEDFARCYYLIGIGYYSLEKYNQSLEAFHSACVVSFSDPSKEFYNRSMLYSARILYLMKEFSKAVPLFEYVIQNGSNYSKDDYYESLIKLCNSYNASENAGKSVKLYEKLNDKIEDEEVQLAFDVCVAESYELCEKYLESYNLYYKVLERGESKYSVLALKKAYLIASDRKIGINPAEVFEKTRQFFTDNQNLLNEFWIRLGIEEYKSKNYSQAEKFFNNADEDGLVIFYKLKIAYENGKKAEEVLNSLYEKKENILSSEYENISDSYYSFIVQLLFTLKNYQAIAENYQAIVQPDARTIYYFAGSMSAQAKYVQATEFLSENLSEAKYSVSKNKQVWELFANVSSKCGDLEKSLELYKMISENGSLSEKGKLEYSKVLFLKKDYQLGLQYSSQTALNEGKYVAGLCAVNLEKWNVAVENFSIYIKNSVSEKDFNSLAFFYKGYAEYYLNDYQNAYKSYESFIKIADVQKLNYLLQAYELAAKTAVQNKDYKNAIVQAENLLKYSVSEEGKRKALLFCAEIYVDNKDFGKAVSLLLPYIDKKDAFAVEVCFELASIYLKQGDVLQADKMYAKVYTDFPADENGQLAMYRSAEIFYAAGEYSFAQTRFNKYIYQYVNGKFYEQALFYCADCYYKMGELEKSIMMNTNFVQKYLQSNFNYAANKNLLNAYFDSKNYDEALNCAKNIVKKYPNESSSDEINSKIQELEKIVKGIDPKIAKLIQDYEKNGKASSLKGRKIGTELVMLYAENSETSLEAFTLATEIFNSVSENSENLIKAQNAQVIADYNRSINENKKAAEMYLISAENYRSSSKDNSKAAAALYGAVEAFVTGEYIADAKETSNLLLKLYPESKQAAAVKRLIK